MTGSHQLSLRTGLLSGAELEAGDTVLSLRWTDEPHLCLLQGVSALVAGVSGAARVDLQIFRARQFTSPDSGGLDVTPYGVTLLVSGALRAAEHAGLTPGTRTLDANPFSLVRYHTELGRPAGGRLLERTGWGEHPLVLGQDEGVVVTVGPAASIGSFTIGFEMLWMVAPRYDAEPVSVGLPIAVRGYPLDLDYGYEEEDREIDGEIASASAPAPAPPAPVVRRVPGQWLTERFANLEIKKSDR